MLPGRGVESGGRHGHDQLASVTLGPRGIEVSVDLSGISSLTILRSSYPAATVVFLPSLLSPHIFLLSFWSINTTQGCRWRVNQSTMQRQYSIDIRYTPVNPLTETETETETETDTDTETEAETETGDGDGDGDGAMTERNATHEKCIRVGRA